LGRTLYVVASSSPSLLQASIFQLPRSLSLSLLRPRTLSYSSPYSHDTIKFILDISTLNVLIVTMSPILDFNTEAVKHLKLLGLNGSSATSSSVSGKPQLPEEMVTAPLFSLPVCNVLSAMDQGESTSQAENQVYPQYGLLGHRIYTFPQGITQNFLVYTNTAAPWSTFICGSQGSGKSHTLSCLLENSLIASSPAGRLTAPLAGVVFHYDKFTGCSTPKFVRLLIFAPLAFPSACSCLQQTS
jgi:hypothetical protein